MIIIIIIKYNITNSNINNEKYYNVFSNIFVLLLFLGCELNTSHIGKTHKCV